MGKWKSGLMFKILTRRDVAVAGACAVERKSESFAGCEKRHWGELVKKELGNPNCVRVGGDWTWREGGREGSSVC